MSEKAKCEHALVCYIKVAANHLMCAQEFKNTKGEAKPRCSCSYDLLLSLCPGLAHTAVCSCL